MNFYCIKTYPVEEEVEVEYLLPKDRGGDDRPYRIFCGEYGIFERCKNQYTLGCRLRRVEGQLYRHKRSMKIKWIGVAEHEARVQLYPLKKAVKTLGLTEAINYIKGIV